MLASSARCRDDDTEKRGGRVGSITTSDPPSAESAASSEAFTLKVRVSSMPRAPPKASWSEGESETRYLIRGCGPAFANWIRSQEPETVAVEPASGGAIRT